MKLHRSLLAVAVVLMAGLACNLPTRLGQADLRGTITAQAATLAARSSTPASTSTPSTVQLTVNASAACRRGPTGVYALVFTLNPGASGEVVGKNTATNHWIITDPAGDVCWLEAQYAVVTGDTTNLPEYPVPPAPTPGPTETPKPTRTPKNTKTPTPTPTDIPTVTPAGPNYATDLVLTKTCTDSTFQGQPWWYEDIVMSWKDNSNDEDGFRIYTKNRENPTPRLVHTLGPNVTVFLYQISYHHGTVHFIPEDDFAVAAFNARGESVPWWGYLKRCPPG